MPLKCNPRYSDRKINRERRKESIGTVGLDFGDDRQKSSAEKGTDLLSGN